jgi:uncharacterized repeat protein (TIGR03803 family)
MKITRCATLISCLGLLFPARAGAIFFTNLYSFSASTFTAAGQNVTGYNPKAGLVFLGSTLYGTTVAGGSNNLGTVFAYSTSSGYNDPSVHDFDGQDGASPQGDLAISGNILYGTTAQGGAYGGGTVFAVNTNGTGFEDLFNFAFTNGANPVAGMVLSGNTLYGTTSKGGAYGAGTLFAINTDGSGFTNLYNFNCTNGANPQADLLLLGNTLYGTTVNGGGSNGLGTVFAINTDGTGFTNLFVFNGPDGANPLGGVTSISNLLCGTASNGGSNNFGVAFLLATNGTYFTNFYNFKSSAGFHPNSDLAVYYSSSASAYILYGTSASEPGNDGEVFGLVLVVPGLTLSPPTPFGVPASFSGVSVGGVVLVPGSETFYWTVQAGGLENGGEIDGYAGGGRAAGPFGFPKSQSYAMTNSDGAAPLAGLALSGHTLYGTASQNGVNGVGSVFAINTDGSGFANLQSLAGRGDPLGNLTVSGNTLYGTASLGNSIFALNTDGTGFTNFATVTQPNGPLVLAGDTLYGTTEQGDIFSVNTDGTDFSNPRSLGAISEGVVLSGNTLYGTTQTGGGNAEGAVYSVNTDGSDLTNFFVFNGADGFNPTGPLILSGHTLYGTTESDTIRGYGTVFAVNTDGSGFTNLYLFNGYDGANPLGGLILCGDTLYGTTSSGGSGGYGTVFAINTNGTGFANLYNFTGSNDGGALYDGLLLSGNTLYGTSSSGGANGNGTVFALSLGPIPLNVQPSGGNVILTWGNPAFSLLSSATVNGPYAPVIGASSPYTNTFTGSQEFFRLQAP